MLCSQSNGTVGIGKGKIIVESVSLDDTSLDKIKVCEAGTGMCDTWSWIPNSSHQEDSKLR